jgi:hypothetical protein
MWHQVALPCAFKKLETDPEHFLTFCSIKFAGDSVQRYLAACWYSHRYSMSKLSCLTPRLAERLQTVAPESFMHHQPQIQSAILAAL